MKILYVCPYAHYSGHHPHVVMLEPKALKDTGDDVTLLTFCGIIDNNKPNVKHIETMPKSWGKVLSKARSKTILRWFLMVLETYLTLNYAVKVYKKHKFDFIHIRDGDPFLFIPFLILSMNKNVKAAISVLGSVLFAPRATPSLSIKYLYTKALDIINSRVWDFLYRKALRNNKIVLLAQNDKTVKAFNEYHDGLFKNRVFMAIRGVELAQPIHMDGEAKLFVRQSLGIPLDAFVLLSFGAPHQGKNLDIVFKAVDDNTFIVHAGKHSYSLGGSPQDMADKYGVTNCKIDLRFIPENDKYKYFMAADAVILSYTKIFSSTTSMLYDATNYGIPVIASNNEPLATQVRTHNLGVVFEAENVESLKKAIKEFRQIDDRGSYKATCRNFAKSYSIGTWAKMVHEAYNG